MPNPDRCQTHSQDGISFEDEVFVFGGIPNPWLLAGSADYPQGTRYFQSNGNEYVKGPPGSIPAQNDYELRELTGGGGSTFDVVEVSADYTASLWDVVLCDASAGDLTITIPSATVEVDSQIIIKIKANGASNAYYVRVITTDSSLFEGEDDMLLEILGTSQTLISDGTDWRAI